MTGKDLFVTSGVKAGVLNALVKNMMSQMGVKDPNEAIRLVNSREWVILPNPANPEPERKWREEDGVIYFTVTSNGLTGGEWIKRLEGMGFRVDDYARNILYSSKEFIPTSGVTFEVEVLKGELFSDDQRTTTDVLAEADKRNLEKPSPEIACLIRDKFTDEEIKAMGLWWLVVLHGFISIGEGAGSSKSFGIRYSTDPKPWLNADRRSFNHRWNLDCGFVFIRP